MNVKLIGSGLDEVRVMKVVVSDDGEKIWDWIEMKKFYEE